LDHGRRTIDELPVWVETARTQQPPDGRKLFWCGKFLKKNRLTGFNAILSFFDYFGNWLKIFAMELLEVEKMKYVCR